MRRTRSGPPPACTSHDGQPEAPQAGRKVAQPVGPGRVAQQCFGFLNPQGALGEEARRAGTEGTAASEAATGGQWTEVELYWTRGACEHWLRLGKPVSTRITGRARRIECYAPGQVFALVRWASNTHGTVLSRIDVLQAVGHGEPCERIADVTPGAAIVLSARSWRTVRRVFALVDAIEALGIDPCAIDTSLWRAVHNRLPGALPQSDPSPHAGSSPAQQEDQR